MSPAKRVPLGNPSVLGKAGASRHSGCLSAKRVRLGKSSAPRQGMSLSALRGLSRRMDAAVRNALDCSLSEWAHFDEHRAALVPAQALRPADRGAVCDATFKMGFAASSAILPQKKYPDFFGIFVDQRS